MPKFWTVLEIQKHDNGAFSALANAYESYAKAESAYYTALAAAAVSTLPYHGAYIIDDEQGVIDMKIYDRRNAK